MSIVLFFKKLQSKYSHFRKVQYFKKIHRRISLSIRNTKHKQGKIKVAFLHMYATDCQNLSIFDAMLAKDSIFDPYFIINPDISRSKDNLEFNYNRSKSELIKKYGKNRVLDGYSFKTGQYFDYTDKFVLATTNNPYDDMAHLFFRIKYWSQKDIPIFYISYFYMGRCFVSKNILESDLINYVWKFFVENDYVLDLAKKYELIKGKNIIVSGSPKMDALFNHKIDKSKKRKQIIIAPHHTIDSDKRSVGGFLQYYDVLLHLPQKFSEIDFIFRPHPLLFENLQKKYWGKEKLDQYLDELLKYDNVFLSTEGDYINLFANSDALIHDCGSFSAEYLYTHKPCAYFLKNGISPDLIWTDFGKRCIDMHYIIKNGNDLESFIQDVVIKENDYKKSERIDFLDKSVAVNYPNCTNFIINYLEKELKK